jgi:hypothetical protein
MPSEKALHTMGERGHTVHALDGKLGNGAQVSGRLALLGCNKRWTTFVPTKASTFDSATASKTLNRALVHVWFDDDVGVTVQAYASGDLVGELSLPRDDAKVTEADLAFIETLEELGVLSRTQRAALLKRMSDPAGLRQWTMGHGLEKLLELPFYDPMPSELPERELLKLLPEVATVLEPKKARKVKSAKGKARTPKSARAGNPMAPRKESWSDRETRRVDELREPNLEGIEEFVTETRSPPPVPRCCAADLGERVVMEAEPSAHLSRDERKLCSAAARTSSQVRPCQEGSSASVERRSISFAHSSFVLASGAASSFSSSFAANASRSSGGRSRTSSRSCFARAFMFSCLADDHDRRAAQALSNLNSSPSTPTRTVLPLR